MTSRDSRAYLFRYGALQQLTHDHTLAQQLVDAGALPSLEMTSRRMQHMLVNCLGGDSTTVKVETHHVQLRDGDQLLLCTDGLTDMLNENQIVRVLEAQQSPDAACRALVDLALDCGGRDNVTVVVARYSLATKALTVSSRV